MVYFYKLKLEERNVSFALIPHLLIVNQYQLLTHFTNLIIRVKVTVDIRLHVPVPTIDYVYKPRYEN